MKHWRNWNIGLANPLLLWKLHWTDSGKLLEYKMTNLKKLGTCLILCRPLCGPLRSLDVKVIWNWKLTNKIKWKDNTKATNLERPSLVEFSSWLNDQIDIYDDCYPKVSGKFSSQPPKNKAWFGGSSAVTERQKTFSSKLTSRPKSTNSPRIMGNGHEQKFSYCPKFKALRVQERLGEVQKHALCFSFLSPQHWLSNFSNQKQCGVNGCSRSHNALLHNLRNVTSMENSDLSWS